MQSISYLFRLLPKNREWFICYFALCSIHFLCVICVEKAFTFSLLLARDGLYSRVFNLVFCGVCVDVWNLGFHQESVTL